MTDASKVIQDALAQLTRPMEVILASNRATQEILAIVVAKLSREADDPKKWLADLQQEIAVRRAEAMSDARAKHEHKDFAADVMEHVDRFFSQFKD